MSFKRLKETFRANGMVYAVCLAFLAATLYAVNIPLSKILLAHIPSSMLAALLYLGAGLGVSVTALGRLAAGRAGREEHLARRDWPYAAGMILLDIAAPILLMLGLRTAAAANVSLLNNFEIVATTVISLLFFREKVSGRLWAAILLITLASLLLSAGEAGSFTFSVGSLFVLLACVCWGIENNCTRVLSQKDPLEIVIVKGFGSGTGALLIALSAGERFPAFWPWIVCALCLGFLSYGLSITCYVRAQRRLGAAKTSAFYAVAPFIGTALSLLLLGERPSLLYYVALLPMVAGAWLAVSDGLRKK